MIRNKSVIVDLFQGQLKSQVRCKTCGHISVRFDPFTFLSLPLPMESSMHVEIVGESYQDKSRDYDGNKDNNMSCLPRVTFLILFKFFSMKFVGDTFVIINSRKIN